MELNAILPSGTRPSPLRGGAASCEPHAHGRPTDPVARTWLAAALEVAPDALNLAREPRGRPRLGPPQAGFDCSWSHSGDGLLIALGEGVELGVDCERVRARPRALDVAARWLPGGAVEVIETFSFSSRFESMLRGVIELRDLAFFILLGAGWLWANILVLEERKGN